MLIHHLISVLLHSLFLDLGFHLKMFAAKFKDFQTAMDTAFDQPLKDFEGHLQMQRMKEKRELEARRSNEKGELEARFESRLSEEKEETLKEKNRLETRLSKEKDEKLKEKNELETQLDTVQGELDSVHETASAICAIEDNAPSRFFDSARIAGLVKLNEYL